MPTSGPGIQVQLLDGAPSLPAALLPNPTESGSLDRPPYYAPNAYYTPLIGGDRGFVKNQG